MSVVNPKLGRIVPSDWKHVERYPLFLGDQPEAVNQPVTFGINWYRKFSAPIPTTEHGKTVYWIGLGNEWGPIDGGHAITAEPANPKKQTIASWWRWYNQPDGSCTGFSGAYHQSLNNREQYLAHALYEEAQKVDEWSDTPPEEGSSVRAAFDVMRTKGLRKHWWVFDRPWNPNKGISANRWLTNVDDILLVLGTPGYVTLLQTWGESYPMRVRIPAEAIDRLLREDGECTTATDR